MIALSLQSLWFSKEFILLSILLCAKLILPTKKIKKHPYTCAHKYHKHAHLPMTRHDPDPPTAGKLRGMRQKQSWNAGNDKVASRDQQTIVKPNLCAKKMNVYWWIEQTNIDCQKNTSCPDEKKMAFAKRHSHIPEGTGELRGPSLHECWLHMTKTTASKKLLCPNTAKGQLAHPCAETI